MKVAMYYNNHDLRIEEVPTPEIGSGELLVRIEASGICGSDLMEWYRIDKVPLVLGHEIAGKIVKVGEGVRGYKEGDRITAAHHVPCNTCHYCYSGHQTVCETLRQTRFDPGGFAEYVRLAAINVDRGVYLLPDEVSYEEATFTEPLACVLRGQRLARLAPGQTVMVIGSGISGLLHIQLASTIGGAGRVVATDIDSYRLEQARHFGADHTLRTEEYTPEILRQLNDGRLADLVVVCTTAKEAFLAALDSVERGGTVLFFAPTDQDITFPLSINSLFWRNEVTLTSSYAGNPSEYALALKLLQSGKVRVREMITHQLRLEEVGLGFRLVAKTTESLKVIIKPHH